MKNNFLGTLFLLSTQLFSMGSFQVFSMEANMSSLTTEPVMGKGGHTQLSLTPGNLKVIEDFRSFYQTHREGSSADVMLAEHQDCFLPFAHHLLDTMKQEIQPEHLSDLIKEVESNIVSKKVSPTWLFDMHFRYLSIQGGISEEEQELLDHVPHNKYVQALMAKDIKGNPIVLDLYKWMGHLDHQGEYYYTQNYSMFYYVEGVSNESKILIEKEIARLLPIPIIYPSLGEGILPMRMLIRNWFKEIYHVAFPTTTTGYHGIKNASRVGFAFHDLFHFKIDKLRESLEVYIQQMVAQGVMGGGHFAVDIIPKVVELAIEKYSLIMEALETAYLALENDSQAVVGFFNMIHEVENNFSPEFFNLATPHKILEAMLENGLQHYSDPGSWENPDDSLNTSVEGDTALTDEEISSIAIDILLKDSTFTLPYQIYTKRNEQNEFEGYVTDPEEKRLIGQKWLREKTRKTVIRLSQFVDAKFLFPDGSENVMSFPTLKRKWVNADASLSLLKYAGIHDLIKPQLRGQDKIEDRKEALEFITLLKTKLAGTMQDFTQKATTVFGEGAGSYAEDFERRYNSLHAKLMDVVSVN